MSDTPRTDAMEYYFYHDSCAGESIYTVIGDNDVTLSKGFEGYSTPSDFSRQLERELAEVTKQRDVLLEGLEKIASLDFVITLPNRMDAVRIIAYGTLNKIKHDNEPTTHPRLPRSEPSPSHDSCNAGDGDGADQTIQGILPTQT